MILKSEQKLEQMVDIMADLQQYIPTVTTTEEYMTIESDKPISVILDDFHHILFGKKCSFLVQLYIRTCICMSYSLSATKDGLLRTDKIICTCTCIVGPYIHVLHEA